MKKLLSLISMVAVFAISAHAQDGTLGKPGATDTVSGTGTYTMKINPTGTLLGNKKAVGAHFTVTKVDSVKGYVKLQAKINGSYADVGPNPGDSTMVSLQNVAGSKGYILHSPTGWNPLLYDNWQLVLVVSTPAKFTISGNWSAK
jgi:hypothetical protein